MPKIAVLLHGFRFNTDTGIPGFCSVLLIEGTKRTLVDVGHVGRRVVLENALKQQKGVIVLTLHLGNWELFSVLAEHLNQPMVAAVKSPFRGCQLWRCAAFPWPMR